MKINQPVFTVIFLIICKHSTNKFMKKYVLSQMKIILVLSICLIISSVFVTSASDVQRKAYIVYMGSLPEGEYSPSMHHKEIINHIIDPSFSSKALIRSYQRSFNGFAAYLSTEERNKLASFDGVLSVFPCRKLQLHTTNSWDFMGFPRRIERHHVIESDMIIGVIDTGIWPEAESFSDQGLGPIPKKWKGKCEGGKNFTCNKKIIGARWYNTEKTNLSARDKDGHGTHIALIAAGNEVKGANFYGLGKGIARGGVPSARIAIYKVCEDSCTDTDILTAFDDAIADGVDVISVTMAGNGPVEVNSDPIAVGSFHANQKNILTVTSAGNTGPSWFSVANFAPWLLVVAASDSDRLFGTKVVLGNGSVVVGTYVNAFSSSEGVMPLVYGKEVTNNCSVTDAKKCLKKCIESSRVHQKVVLCDQSASVEVVAEAGALGCIIPKMETQLPDVQPITAAALTTNEFNLVKNYKRSSKKPESKILKSESLSNPTAPRMASFSSRGPCIFTPDILKPDVTAPGVEILAAFSPMGSPSGVSFDTRSTEFNVISGTSVASAHVVAAAAYVKSFHPTWSVSAIKSALMTTAWKIDPTQLDAEFAYGSGHIDPVKAKDPGLIYEISRDEYLNIWCHISESPTTSILSKSKCPKKLDYSKINYPSMAKQVALNSAFVIRFPRTVKNVGKANSTYVASIVGKSSKLHISVEPKRLHFTSHNQNMSFVVTVRGNIKSPQTLNSASLVWKDRIHHVRSPVVVYSGTTVSRGDASMPSRVFEMFVVFLLVFLMY